MLLACLFTMQIDERSIGKSDNSSRLENVFVHKFAHKLLRTQWDFLILFMFRAHLLNVAEFTIVEIVEQK